MFEVRGDHGWERAELTSIYKQLVAPDRQIQCRLGLHGLQEYGMMTFTYLSRLGLELIATGSYGSHVFFTINRGSLFERQEFGSQIVTYPLLQVTDAPVDVGRPKEKRFVSAPFLPKGLPHCDPWSVLSETAAPSVVPVCSDADPIRTLSVLSGHVPKEVLGVKDGGHGGRNPYGHAQTGWDRSVLFRVGAISESLVNITGYVESEVVVPEVPTLMQLAAEVMNMELVAYGDDYVSFPVRDYDDHIDDDGDVPGLVPAVGIGFLGRGIGA
jgi:hypothetical protein